MRYERLAGAVLVAFSGSAAAAVPSVDQATNFTPVVVTATRVEQSVEDTLAPVVVITRDDIERLQPQSVMDLFKGLPGVAVANSGGMGQITSVFMRGTNTSHTLVLVDGVRMGSVTDGAAAWAQIPVDQIARIEIVRGPRSSLYGADAIGGVVQIFTRHGGTDEGLLPSFHVSGGSHNTWNGAVGLSGGGQHGWFNASLGMAYTRGINSCKLGAGAAFAGCFADEPDADGYRAYSGLLSGGYRWDGGVQLTGMFFRDTNFVEYDGGFQNYSRHAQQVEGVHLRVPINEAWRMRASLGRSLDKASNYLEDHDTGKRQFTGYQDSRRDQASWINTVNMATGQLLNLGVDWQREHVDSDTAYLRNTIDNTGVFALYQGHFGANELQLSLRRDDNEQFGNHSTGALAWGYHFASDLTLSLSYATAFHAPTFNDLYWPAAPGFPPSSDPHLKPEKSRNLGIDLSARHATWHWQVSAYRNQIDDLIALDAQFTPGNISQAVIRGLEGQIGGQWRAWVWNADFTWQKPENDDGGPNDGNLLPRRFERSARLDLDHHWDEFSAGFTIKAFNARYDDIANRHRLGGYGLLNLRGAWQFAAHWQVQLSLRNALGHDYETVYYFNQPGRTGMLTLRYRP